MQNKIANIKRCWICGDLANSGEHRIKKGDIVSKYGKGSYVGADKVCIVKGSKIKEIHGAKSDLLKYEEVLCSKCNNTNSQPFDKAYEKFIDYIDQNKAEILYKRCIDFYKVYGDNFEKEQRNLYKYFVKSFGCRLSYFGHYIPRDMIELLDLDSFQTGLRLNFSINEDKLLFGRLDDDMARIIGNGNLYTNQGYANKTSDMKFYLYDEFYDWLHINYYYNYIADGSLGSIWVADNQFIYLGSFYSSLTGEMRKEVYDKVLNKKPQALSQKDKDLLGDSELIIAKKCIKVKNQFVSKSRLKQYKNLEEYIENIRFSSEFYMPLSLVEIGLRNSLNQFFIERVDKNWLFDKKFIKPQLQNKINQSIKTLKQQNKQITQNNLIAELSFGFWVMLLKKPYQEYLRFKDLNQIFLNIDKKGAIVFNRHYFFTIINKIRLFRNKVFHFDKIINKKEYDNIQDDIYLILEYFDSKLLSLVNGKW